MPPMTRREPAVGDIWAWVSYSDKAHYLILDINVKEEKHYTNGGSFYMVTHTYYNIMALEDGKIYADYTCNNMGTNPGWRFIC